MKAAADPASDTTEPPGLTTVDRYYLAWTTYQTHHGTEPTGQQLSTYLAAHGLHGRNQQPISPANLRRYFLPWRIYDLWTKHRKETPAPSPSDIARECAAHGITAQYNKPITPQHITKLSTDFERRWQALTRHHTNDCPGHLSLPAQPPALTRPHL
ncbi:hypothetical protein GRC12_39870 [Streptomyces griseorubiginosus]|nr:hypothetical protein [Streptomyces griseorubiginosus]